MMMRWVAVGLSLLLVLLSTWVSRQYQWAASASLSARLAQIVPVQGQAVIDCATVAAQQPIVLLALGQSNAGNHGQMASAPLPPVLLLADGKCLWATDPLPGGTGRGGSIWQRLPARMQALGWQRPVLLSVIGVEATSVADWTEPTSPLHRKLIAHLQTMAKLGLAPRAVLWQQGEADARLGTSAKTYGDHMEKLALALVNKAPIATLFVANSTVCRAPPSEAVRLAVRQKVNERGVYREGPDTDVLVGPSLRADGCHFSAAGLDAAAARWATELKLWSLTASDDPLTWSTDFVQPAINVQSID